jgi:hypothetical protein
VSALPAYLPEQREFTLNQAVKLAVKWMERTALRLVLHDAMTARTGRRRILAPSSLLMLVFIYAVTHKHTLWLTDVARMARTLTTSQRLALGITKPVTYWQIDNGMTDLAHALETLDSHGGSTWPQGS